MIAWSGLHVLADDDRRWSKDPVAQARDAVAGGAAVIQLRSKHAADRVALAWAREIRSLTREADVRFVMNDRFDLALLAEADAVHLGQDDLSPAEIPEAMRARLAIGRSSHTPEQARAALEEPIDYLAFGPVFGTESKASPYTARGLDALDEIVKLAGGCPVVAIGGIDETNLPDLIRAGARGAAVISAVAGASDPVVAVRRLVTSFAERADAEASR